jgi:hypothetical protein
MQEKVKGMLKGMSMPKKKPEAKMPESMVEGEEEGSEEAPEVEINLEDMGGEEEGMPEESSALADVSDEELMAELKKRGLEVASGGTSILPLPEPGPEEEPAPAPAKKTYKA